MTDPPSPQLPAAATSLAGAAPGAARPRSCTDLFITFTLLALQGFGGVLAISQRVLCEQRQWLTRAQFVETLAFAQILPGPNVCNIALMVGDRYFGGRGAAAALAGMMAVPLVIVLGVTALLAGHADQPQVAGALRGMGAVAAGLILGTVAKLVEGLRGNPLGAAGCGLFGVAAFVAVGVLRLPLVTVLLGLGVPAWLYAGWRIRRKLPQDRR
jgi:chromate transporter